MTIQEKADVFLDKYLAEYQAAYKKQAAAYWQAANSGTKEDFEAYAAADLAIKQLHSDPHRYAEILALLADKETLHPLTARALTVAETDFKGNQLPDDLLEKLVSMSTAIEEIFNNFRGQMDGQEYSNNDLLDLMKKETDSQKRQKIWETLKQVGEEIGPKLKELAKVRNVAAKQLGYTNYWEMEIRLQEHDPAEILEIFANLDQETTEPFKQMKMSLDKELAARFNLTPIEIMPWHYDNPFFQAAPPSAKVNLDEFYEKKTSAEIVAMVKKFYFDLGMPVDDIAARSDMYERPGKQQHAFCLSLDMAGDTRVLMNVKPTCEWMDTSLHEMGHGIYYKYSDCSLPFNLREAAHTFTTEAVAMLFGALGKNPLWLTTYAGAQKQRVAALEEDILEQRRREQLIFARWTLVMLHFEKEMYENPDQDLNTRWWDLVERFQFLKRPQSRFVADWAAKAHFAIAPVYYHNYMLGELFAAQLRATLVKLAKHQGPTHTLNYTAHHVFADFFKEKIFRPGSRFPWPEFVKQATGEALTAKYFAAEGTMSPSV